MHIIHDKHLSIITGIGKNFLVTGHPGIKTYFTGCSAGFTKSFSLKKMFHPVEEEMRLVEYWAFFENSFKMQKKGMLN